MSFVRKLRFLTETNSILPMATVTKSWRVLNCRSEFCGGSDGVILYYNSRILIPFTYRFLHHSIQSTRALIDKFIFFD